MEIFLNSSTVFSITDARSRSFRSKAGNKETAFELAFSTNELSNYKIVTIINE